MVGPLPSVDRLGDDDLMQLAAEASGARMQFAAVAVLDGAATVAAVRDLLAARLNAVPRLRQRLVRVPYGRPVWLDDPDLDLRRHVDEVTCPAPGDRAALLAATSGVVEERLSLARPPWRVVLVTGLAGDRSAVVIVLHHVLADGLAGLAILSRLVDGPAHQPPARSGPSRPRPPLRPSRPTAAQLRAAVRADRRRALRELPRWPGRWRAAAAELLGGGLGRAPSCSINAGPVGPRRALGIAQVDLAGVVDAARTAGGTVNDVLLTAVAGGLERFLAERGEPVGRLVVSVPISARPRASAGELGNRVGVLPVSIRLDGPPGERLPLVTATTRARKTGRPGSSTALYGPLVRGLAAVGAFAPFIEHQRLVNTFLTNVRGPGEPVKLGGLRVRELVPVSAISGNVRVAFAALSYAGGLTVTVVTDADAFPDAGRIAGLVRDELERLSRPAAPAAPPPRPPG